jgi:hypothetical protein
MSKVRLVVKRRDNGKHVSKMKHPFHMMLSEYMATKSLDAGIYSLLTPKSTADLEALKQAKLSHVVAEVSSRDKDSLNFNYLLENLAFAVALSEWWISRSRNPNSPTIERISKFIADEQCKIVRGKDARDKELEAIFFKHAAFLLTRRYSAKWWEERFAELRRKHKKARVKNGL